MPSWNTCGGGETPLKLSEIAREIGAEINGGAEAEISGPAGLEEAGPGQISFLANPRYLPFLEKTRAAAVIVPADEKIRREGTILLRCANPAAAYARVLHLFDRSRPSPPKGIHPQALVSPEARIGRDVSIGAFSVVERGAEIGDGTAIFPLCYIGEGARIGKNCLLWPNAVVYHRCRLGDRVILHAGCVIGSDGFGYAKEGKRYAKIPQIGTVEIGDDVELGAGVTVDRATTGATRIGRGTKIDNLCHIAHNVEIGEDCVMAAQTGVAGSAKIGDRVTFAGQVGLVGHIRVGNDVTFAAKSGIHRDVPDGKVLFGYPAREHAEALKIYAALARLPRLLEEFLRLKQEVKELRGRLG